MGRILITGGSGFIGTNLIDSYLRDGWEVRNLDLVEPRKIDHVVLWERVDVRDAAALSQAVCDFRPTLVVHLAARTDLDGANLQAYDTNLAGVENLLAAVRAAGTAERLMVASSRYVHCNEYSPRREDDYSPFTLYGESKVRTERIVRASNLEIPWTLIRPTSIWGPWFRIPYRTFFDTVRLGLYMHPEGARIRKAYGYVGNVVHQMRAMLHAPADQIGRRTFYVSDDGPMDVLEFAQLIQQAFHAPPVRQAPTALLHGLARVGDGMKRVGFKNPPLTSFRLKNLLTNMDFDLSATTQVAGPAPFSLRLGVEQTVEWMKAHG
jgi:nucleoside-diphosphate-sugar epimerase